MRSEKEIKEFIKYIQSGKLTPDDLKQMLKEIPETKDATLEELVLIRTIYLGVCQAYGKWILEGEPRYSVVELEKIEEAWDGYDADDFVKFLYDTKKVQEALK